MDSVEIGLITCSPHEEVYSLYGHSAIHYRDYRKGIDAVFNWGVFNYKTPHFVWRFIFGTTDYELEAVPFRPFCEYYKGWGSQVTEQLLDLTPVEKQRICNALAENLKPENRTYRYNFFYDNCSTRPRNIIENNLEGEVVYEERPESRHQTFRQMIHDQMGDHRWSAFGNDLLLGFKADLETTQREQQFLPSNLQLDFMNAVVVRNGQRQPLVKDDPIVHVALGEQPFEPGFPLSPFTCAIIFLAINILLFLLEEYKKKTFRWIDVTLMLATGLTGCVLLLMLFSQHPATSTNLQILILNPLSLFFIPSVIRQRKTRWFTLSLYFIIAFFLGDLLQDYAEGMECVALCLLLRYWRHRHDK